MYDKKKKKKIKQNTNIIVDVAESKRRGNKEFSLLTILVHDAPCTVVSKISCILKSPFFQIKF